MRLAVRVVSLVSLFAVTGVAGVTKAQSSVLLLSPGGDAKTARKSAAVRAVHKALEAQGFRVFPAKQAAVDVGDAELAQCNNGSCATDALRALSAKRAVSVAVWRAGRGRPKGLVSVVLSDAEGREVDADQPVDGDIEEAAWKAYATASEKWNASEAATVRIVSDPVGAFVTVDGSPVGQAPVTEALSPGDHTITVSSDGYTTLRESVELVPGEDIDLRYALERETNEAAPSDNSETETSPWNTVLGAALLIGGAGALVSPVWTLASEGNSFDGEKIQFGARSAILMALGISALGVGTYVLIAKPFAIDVSADQTGAQLQLKGTF